MQHSLRIAGFVSRVAPLALTSSDAVPHTLQRKRLLRHSRPVARNRNETRVRRSHRKSSAAFSILMLQT